MYEHDESGDYRLVYRGALGWEWDSLPPSLTSGVDKVMKHGKMRLN